jgi:selenocysteine-specific elongation factor
LRDSGSLVAASTFKVEYKEEHFAMQKRLEKVYLDAGYEVPELEEAISKEKDVNLAKQMVEALAEEGKLKRLTYQYYMHKIHWEKAMKLFQDHMDKKDSITLAEYRDLLDTSRKYAVMILEYLDEQKITRLVDDVRILL